MTPDWKFPIKPRPKPRKNGWYWFRTAIDATPEKVEVLSDGAFVRRPGQSPVQIDYFPGEWGDETVLPPVDSGKSDSDL